MSDQGWRLTFGRIGSLGDPTGRAVGREGAVGEAEVKKCSELSGYTSSCLVKELVPNLRERKADPSGMTSLVPSCQEPL